MHIYNPRAQQNHSSSIQGTPAIPSLLHHKGVGARESARSRSSIGIAVPRSSIGLAGGCHINV